MALPPLVLYQEVSEYKNHFEQNYCREVIYTHDKIRVYFSPNQFWHAFYESPQRDGGKDAFSPVRAQRIDWIRATLEHPEVSLYQGWDKLNKTYSIDRRVSLVYENFVVIVEMTIKRNGVIAAKFITCYQADNSISKIKNSPTWVLADFLESIKDGGGR